MDLILTYSLIWFLFTIFFIFYIVKAFSERPFNCNLYLKLSFIRQETQSYTVCEHIYEAATGKLFQVGIALEWCSLLISLMIWF